MTKYDVDNNTSNRYNSAQEIEQQVRTLIAHSYESYHSAEGLIHPTPALIRAGRAGGLPFNSLTTDVVVGCLPADRICYGNCFAASAAFSHGIDFGARVDNILDETIFCTDLDALPAEQRYLRNGWNSDPSWRWSCALTLAELIRNTGRHTVFLTKCFTKLSSEMMTSLADLSAEIRISVSAFDTEAQLKHRLQTAEAYRSKGGVAVPVVVTGVFSDPILNERQDRIVRYIIERDFPAGENSLRFNPNKSIAALLNKEASRPIDQSGDWWCGRLYPESLLVPTITSLPPQYNGLQDSTLSGNDPMFLESLFFDPVPVHDVVLSSPPLGKPVQAGVPNIVLEHLV